MGTKKIEAYNEQANRVLISLAVGGAGSVVVRGGYYYVMANPISSYNFANAALDGGWSASAWGITSWEGRAGQAVELILKGLYSK